MKPKEEILQTLSQFVNGTDSYHKFSPLSKLIATDGALYVAESCGAYWLLDIIASVQTIKVGREQEFQVYKLKKNKSGNGAVVTMEDGNDNVIYTQKIPFTDFPLDEIILWMADGVILLPSEY